MNEPCAKITLDVQQASTSTFVAVKRGDIGRKIVITLSDGGFPYDIAADCYAVLTGTKPDGNILYNHCDIVGNTIVYEITEQTTASAGRMKAEVKLYGADDILVTSATFRIIIDGTVYTDSQVESSSEFSALTQLISQVVEIIRKYSDVTTVTKTSELINDSGFITNAVSDLVNYYTKTDIGNLLSNIPKFRISAVSVLPTEDISETTIYLLSGGACSDLYTEYLRVDGKWEILGSQRVDLTGYATEEWVEQKLEKHSGGNVELDTTLTQSGKAADAKAVGDKIAEITGISLVEPAEDDIPKVFLTGSEFGNMTTAKNEVKMGLEYISKTDKFKAAIKIKFQGNTSLNFPKKNFTIKMYTDDTYEDKLKKSFKNWNHSSNKYVLKANWIDHSHARNIISANLWSEVVSSRPDYASLPEELRNSPRNGAIDGFPVKLYINGNYEGVYTWNVGKDDWMWGMDEDNVNHVLMCAETNNNGAITNTPCNFRALWSGIDENHWTVEVGTNSTAVKTALNNLIQFVMNNDGDSFRNGIDSYLDIQSAIDYYIFQYDICGLDGLAKNMLLATYDGTKWICGAYDMDATFGLYWDGKKFVSAQYRCPEDYQETYSLLWERIEANFMPELKARQAELRKTVLSYSNIVTHFERFMDIIGLDLYEEDRTIYTGIPSGTTNKIKQIRNYIRDRQTYVDAEFATMTETVACTGISLSATKLTFTEEGTQTITATVTPSDTTDSVVWVSSDPTVASISVIDNVCTVQAVNNGNAVITASCGKYSASCDVSISVPNLTKKYNVTNTLTNCANSNSATVVEEGASYSAVITANDGYALDNVIVTHNGESVSVTDGSFTIENVIGDIIIVASAVKVEVEYELNTEYKFAYTLGKEFNTANGAITYNPPSGLVEEFIKIPKDANFCTMAAGTTVSNYCVVFYDEDKTYVSGYYGYEAIAIPDEAVYVRLAAQKIGDAPTINVTFFASLDFDIAPSWSAEPNYELSDNTGEVVTSENNSYINIEPVMVPAQAAIVKLDNRTGYSFNWLKIVAYDQNDNLLGKVFNNGSGSNITLRITSYAKPVFIRFQANPVGKAENNDPATQVRCYWA